MGIFGKKPVLKENIELEGVVELLHRAHNSITLEGKGEVTAQEAIDYLTTNYASDGMHKRMLAEHQAFKPDKQGRQEHLLHIRYGLIVEFGKGKFAMVSETKQRTTIEYTA